MVKAQVLVVMGVDAGLSPVRPPIAVLRLVGVPDQPEYCMILAHAVRAIRCIARVFGRFVAAVTLLLHPMAPLVAAIFARVDHHHQGSG
jgi:hypothetical protein